MVPLGLHSDNDHGFIALADQTNYSDLNLCWMLLFVCKMVPGPNIFFFKTHTNTLHGLQRFQTIEYLVFIDKETLKLYFRKDSHLNNIP